MRRWFLVDCALVFITGIQLFVLAEFTSRFFAWTINPPLTAAFLGGCYWASLPLVFLSSRQTAWAHARLAVYGVLAFTMLTTVATLMHLDRFHLSAAGILARAAAWTWLTVYLIVPLALTTLLVAQLRLPGTDPARQTPLPGWIRSGVFLHAAFLFVMGWVLFAMPRTAVWPWSLTPLTGRAIGAWLIGVGIVGLQMVWENDSRRVGSGMLAYATLGGLQLVAFVRYAPTVRDSGPSGFLYLVFATAAVILGAVGWRRSWHGTRTRTAAPTETKR